ncbi:Panacea domain-containing protein [Imhoffiella purpurea]|uniref:Panacea domain-containing protein n=1 Tax=Imhoffiella purpurea TaxID=1249627 RepID=UPI0005C254A9|nr:type II toxin-antitoxin system antitoxin SocA domain-containing protein [Imhoffiella purpurea]
MATFKDVARYITEQHGQLTAMKLQKLLYYAQAWNLVWEEEPLFEDDFQAWANGPVLPSLYAMHRGMFKVDASLFTDGCVDALTDVQRENIDRVLSFYGKQTAQWLSDLTHQEDPWCNARGDLMPGEASAAVIPKAALHEYYSSL